MEGEPGRYRSATTNASPLAHVGDGARVVCVHGDADDTVPLSQSERYFEAALLAGDPVKLIVLPGTGHYELIDVDHPAWAACRDQPAGGWLTRTAVRATATSAAQARSGAPGQQRKAIVGTLPAWHGGCGGVEHTAIRHPQTGLCTQDGQPDRCLDVDVDVGCRCR